MTTNKHARILQDEKAQTFKKLVGAPSGSQIEKYLDEFFQVLQHISGPWKYDLQPTYSNAHIYGKYKSHVAEVWGGRHPSDTIVAANSKLISAAPAMLRSICRTYLTLLVKFPWAGSNSTVKEIRISLDSTLASLRNEISIATGLECQHIQDTFEDWAYKINH